MDGKMFFSKIYKRVILSKNFIFNRRSSRENYINEINVLDKNKSLML